MSIATVASACAREADPARSPIPAPGALWFGGDVHFGVSARSGLSDIAPSLAGAVGIVNLEGPLTREGRSFDEAAGGATWEGSRIVLTNPTDAPAKLYELGVRAVSTANNHRMDAGVTGVSRTASALEHARLLSLSHVPEFRPITASRSTLIAYDLENPAAPHQLAQALDEAATHQPSLRVVSLHVTGPASYLPRPELVTAVEVAVAHGADIVFAHGTHVIGPVERRGATVIAWGLGNLFFDCECTTEYEALILRVSLAPGHPAQVIPIRAGLGGRDASLSTDPDGVFDLLAALGSSPLRRGPVAAEF